MQHEKAFFHPTHFSIHLFSSHKVILYISRKWLLSTDELTRVGAEVSCKGIAATAGVVTKGTFEGLLAGVELDVAEQVAFLSEGCTALVTLEWPFTCRDQDYQFSH